MVDIQEVLINAEASPDEVAAVQEVFDSRDLGVEVRAEWRKDPRTGNGAFWMTLVKLTAIPVGAFVTAFMAKAGEATFGALREWVQDLRAARRPSTVAADAGSRSTTQTAPSS